MSELSKHESEVLISIMGRQYGYKDGVPLSRIRDDLEESGFKPIALCLAIESLQNKNMILKFERYTNDPFSTSESEPEDTTFGALDYSFSYIISEEGRKWVQKNLENIQLRKE